MRAPNRPRGALAADPACDTVADVLLVGARDGVHRWLLGGSAPASTVGMVCVNWLQLCLGAAAAGRNIDLWVTGQVLQSCDWDHLLRTDESRRRPGSG